MFQGGALQSDDFAKSGNYSLKLDSQNKKGFGFSLSEVKTGDCFYLSVWKKGQGKIHVWTNNKMDLWGGQISEKDNGWEKLVFQFMIPPYPNQQKITFEVVSDSDKPVYFDDFKIEKLEKGLIYPNISSTDNVNLLFEDSTINQLNLFRKVAFEKGVLTTSAKSWVEGKLVYLGDTLKMKARLKGDWLDHLQNDKWSFRIKLKKGHVLGMSEFSLQTPTSRNYLNEYVYHDFLMKEGVLTTYYDFLPLKINGKSLGVYAIEQHITPELLESQKRREGSLARFDESGFWALQEYEKLNDTNIDYIYPVFYSSRIKPFSKKKTKRDKFLYGLFNEFQNKLQAYRLGENNMSYYFDVNLYAKYYALTDIFKAYHGLVWHNQRFYYNPISKKIEPVAFDSFTANENFVISGRPILAYNRGRFKTNYFSEVDFIHKAFNDKTFRDAYFYYLDYYLYQFDWENYFKSTKQKFTKKTKLLQKEFYQYNYNESEIYENIENIKHILDTVRFDSTNNWFQFESIRDYRKKHPDDQNIPRAEMLDKPIPNVSFFAYSQKEKNDFTTLKLINFHLKDIEITHYGNIQDELVETKGPTVKKADGDEQTIIEWKTKTWVKFLKCKVKGTNYSFIIEIIPYPYPTIYSQQNKVNNTFPFINISGNVWVLKPGSYNINRNVILPKNISIKIEKGANINLTNNAHVLSYSNIYANGATIKSSDFSGSIQILNATKQSEFINCSFEGLGNSQSNHFTGALSFYMTNVSFKNCSFYDLKNEDGINIINSHFTMINCKLDIAQSDGVDIDFSNGSIEDLTVFNCGNDGIDISMSTVNLKGIKISNCIDKGVSVGEKSTVTIKKMSIENCDVGIANKDQSEVDLSDLIISNTNFGFIQFIKKNIYNPPSCNVSKINFIDVSTELLLDERATLTIDGEKIETKGIIHPNAFK